jgi:hypothetical protein
MSTDEDRGFGNTETAASPHCHLAEDQTLLVTLEGYSGGLSLSYDQLAEMLLQQQLQALQQRRMERLKQEQHWQAMQNTGMNTGLEAQQASNWWGLGGATLPRS